MLEVGSVLAGYRIEGLLGKGGMGVVYEATQLSLNRTVAFKLLAEGLGESAVYRERFRREALAQAALEHQNVVTIHEAGELEPERTGGSPRLFIAMRMVRGPTLKELIRAGALDPERSLELLAPVADALDAAHARGLVHRDIKPQNILVGAGDHPYLTDFGLTRGVDERSLTTTGQVIGTLDYISPEQLSEESATTRSDVYALAAVSFECLCGRPPFRRDSEAALMLAHLNAPRPRATEHQPELPGAVDDVLLRGLAREPGERPASPGALIEELSTALTTPGPTTAAHRSAAAKERETGVEAKTVPVAGERTRVTERLPGRDRFRPRVVVTSVGIVAALALGALVLLPGGNGGEPGPGGGSGSTISLGSTLHGEGGTFPCYGPVLNPCTLVQTALPDRETVAPLDGVVVRWRVRFADGDMRLVVVSGGGRKKVEAKTRAESVAEPVARFESRVPIKRGELIGLTLLPGAHTGFKFVDTPGARLERFPPLGETPREPDNAGTSESRHTELLLSAVVEPDEDGDRFGDVTQDRCPDEQGGDGGCP